MRLCRAPGSIAEPTRPPGRLVSPAMAHPTRAALAAGAGALAAAGALLAAPERYRAMRKLLRLERRTGGAVTQGAPVDDVRRSLHDRLAAAGDVVEAPARPFRPAPADSAPLRAEVDEARARLRARAGAGGHSRPRD
jgi:hypothetical protein